MAAPPVFHDCAQGSSEWLRLRAGIPTSSEFDKLLTPRTMKPSASRVPYMHALIAERLMEHPRVEAVSMWMERGSAMEAEAVQFYELQRDTDTVPVGFVTLADGTVGASPDRLVGDGGLLEIKCPAPHTHVGYLLGRGVDDAYRAQTQGQLWITGRSWVDVMSYHPEMPAALVRVERDDEYIGVLSGVVMDFAVELEREWQALVERLDWRPKAPRARTDREIIADAYAAGIPQ